MFSKNTLASAVVWGSLIMSATANAAPGFYEESGQTFASAVARSAATGDVDNDGDLDIFIINENYNRVEILQNDGQGNMTSVTDNSISISAAPTRVELADLDGDGDLDAFVTYKMKFSSVDPRDVVFLNDGAGNFSDTGIRVGNGESRDVTLGDIDGDGDIDAFVVSSSCAEVETIPWCNPAAKEDRVWLNDGSANFTLADSVFRPSSYDADFGDVDGDGDLDLMIVNSSGGYLNELLLNDGMGSFTNSGETFEYKKGYSEWVELIDLDNDGDLDAYVGNKKSSYAAGDRVWLNDGNGVFSDSGQLLSGARPSALGFGDVDNDGDIDVFVGTNYNQNDSTKSDQVWFNDGTGMFTNSGQMLQGAKTHAVAMGDFDGDGDLDAFAGSWNSYVDSILWWNNGQNQSTNCATILAVGGSVGDGIYTIDPKGDGNLRDVYCDMTTLGGGWTLYANNHNQASLPVALVTPNTQGVVDAHTWQGIRDNMTEGMMFIDEHDRVSMISESKINSANCRTTDSIDDLANITPQGYGGYRSMWHDETSGCTLTGVDYGLVTIGGDFGGYYSHLYQLTTMKFDIWPYNHPSYSYNEQSHLLYFIK